MKEVNVICMKWGDLYSHEYVNNLYYAVKKNLKRPFKFICFTENGTNIDKEIIVKPLPEVNVPTKHDVSPWRKLGAYAEDLGGLTGKTMFLDLDNIIIDNIDCFFDYSDKFSIVENWTQIGKGIGNSTVYVFEIGKYSFLLEDFIRDPMSVIDKYDNEQIYVSKTLGKELVFFPAEWCKSFKRHCLRGKRFFKYFLEPIIPENVKIIAFHGHPRPHEAVEGRWPGTIIPYFKKPKWLAKYWGSNK